MKNIINKIKTSLKDNPPRGFDVKLNSEYDLNKNFNKITKSDILIIDEDSKENSCLINISEKLEESEIMNLITSLVLSNTEKGIIVYTTEKNKEFSEEIGNYKIRSIFFDTENKFDEEFNDLIDDIFDE